MQFEPYNTKQLESYDNLNNFLEDTNMIIGYNVLAYLKNELKKDVAVSNREYQQSQLLFVHSVTKMLKTYGYYILVRKSDLVNRNTNIQPVSENDAELLIKQYNNS